MHVIEKNEVCCTVACEQPLDQAYWEAQYQAQATGWDLGQVSPPLKIYIDQIQNKNIAILIAGAGNAYEASYLLEKGFTDITVIDIAPSLIGALQNKFAEKKGIRLLLGDFFAHQGTYDLILEQTFFCAIPPYFRPRYVGKMHELLAPAGKLAGLLFERTFEKSPPFGGSRQEYERLFQEAFFLDVLISCQDSIEARKGSELFFEFSKNAQVQATLYEFEGITCQGCMDTVCTKVTALPHVQQALMSSDYSELLVVTTQPIALEVLQNTIAYEAKYKIKKK